MNARWGGVVIGAMAALGLACASHNTNARPPSTAERAANPQLPGTSQESAAENHVAQEAPASRPQEGAGGKNPMPLPSDQAGQARYGNQGTAPAPGMEGRVPSSRTPAEQAQNAQNATPSDTARTPAVDARNHVSGRVAAIDPQSREIAIDTGTATTQVKVANDARIVVDGKAASFQDIRRGADVRATLSQGSDTPEATSIEVQPHAAQNHK